MLTYQGEGLAALGDPTRRAIFEHLADEPRAVGELARELPVNTSTTTSTARNGMTAPAR